MTATEEFVAALETRADRLGFMLVKREYAEFMADRGEEVPPEEVLFATLAAAGYEKKRDERGWKWARPRVTPEDGLPQFVKDYVASRSCRVSDRPAGLTERDPAYWAFGFASVPVGLFYEEMAEACAAAGVTPPGPKAFSQYLLAQGYKHDRNREARYWLGLTRHPSQANAIADRVAETLLSASPQRAYVEIATEEYGYYPGYQWEDAVDEAFRAAITTHSSRHGPECDFSAPCQRAALAEAEAAAGQIEVPAKGTFYATWGDVPEDERDRIKRAERDWMGKIIGYRTDDDPDEDESYVNEDEDDLP